MKIRMKLPRCDFCGTYQAIIDGKTHAGTWAFMCQGCFDLHGVGVGADKGEYLLWIQTDFTPLSEEKKP